jgi:hypothetical protein
MESAPARAQAQSPVGSKALASAAELRQSVSLDASAELHSDWKTWAALAWSRARSAPTSHTAIEPS